MPDTLAPRLTFPGAESGWLGVHLLAIVCVLVIIWRLLRWERQLTSPSIGWLLLGLRGACLLVILLTLFQPTWAWVISRAEYGRLIVALDVSDSMETTDPQATSRERLGWAVGLGWLAPHVLAAEPADELESAANVGQPPSGVDPRVWSDVLDRSRSISRVEIGRRLLVEGRRPLLPMLESLGKLDLYWFGGVSRALSPETLRHPFDDAPIDLVPEATRLDSALGAAVQADGRVLGVILLTDGRDTASPNTIAVARQLADRSIPVYPVLIGSDRRPRDLAIVSIDAPQSVYKGDRAKVRVQISTSGFTDVPLDVTFRRAVADDDDPLETRELTGGEAPSVLEFDLPAEDVGRHEYFVAIAPQPGEMREDNNTRSVRLQVVDDRTRVLLVDGEPRWEFRYLEAALARDERVKLDVVLFDQPYLALLPEPFFPTNWPMSDDSQDDSPFTDRDLVVLGDVPPQRMTDADWEALADFVGEDGGTLVLIAGRQAMPVGHSSAALRSLLPITQPRPVQFSAPPSAPPTLRGWTWSLTPEGEQQTCLQFADTREANQAIWNVLPGATTAIAGDPKPAATVWAWGHTANNADPAVPLMVHQYYGVGQVIWLASDSTWRWRFRSGDQFHHRFWGQLARWAATTKLSAGNQFVQFGPLKSQYALSEEVEVQARWAARSANTTVPESADVEIRRGDDVISRVTLSPDEKRPRVSVGRVGRLPPGDYVARLNLEKAEPLDAPFSVIAPPSSELADVTANRELLQQLADVTGGKLFEPADVADLPREFRPFESLTELPQERPLWDRWPTFLMLVGLLTVEWIVRRVNGLP